MIAPLLIVHEELISNSAGIPYCGTGTMAGLLYAGRFIPSSPTVFEVEAVLEAVVLDSGEMTA